MILIFFYCQTNIGNEISDIVKDKYDNKLEDTFQSEDNVIEKYKFDKQPQGNVFKYN